MKTKKIGKISALFFILLLIVSASCKQVELSPPRAIRVPGDFTRIQDAIDAAHRNDTIFISKGIYEGPLVIKRKVHLKGESPETVIIIPSEKSNEDGITFDFFSKGSSVSSLQIRGFRNCVKLTYTKGHKLSNCILIPESITESAFWIQGSAPVIENSTIMGEILLSSKAAPRIEKNIIYSNQKAIKVLKDKGETISPTISNNVIYGSVDLKVDSTNIFADPTFSSIEKFDFASPYTAKGYGANISGLAPPLPPPDQKGPEIIITSPDKLEGANLPTDKALILKLDITDESPIRRVEINNAPVVLPEADSFQRTKYKVSTETQIILQEGQQVVSILAVDHCGNQTIKNTNVYVGDILKARANLKDNKKFKEPREKKIKKVAWVVGVNDYPKEIPRISYSINDAKAIKRLLTQNNYHVIYRKNPDYGEMVESLEELEKLVGPDDKVILYYSGHGSCKSTPFNLTSGLLLPAGLKLDRLGSTAFPMEKLRTFVTKLESSRVVIILDTCFAGGGKSYGPTPRLDKSNIITEQLMMTGKGKILLASSGDLEKSFEDPKLKHGVFTYYLLEAVGKGLESIDDIYQYVFKKAKDRSGQKPRKETLSETIGLQPLL